MQGWFLSSAFFAAIGPVEGGIVFCGLLRGLAGISLGSICFLLAEKLSKIEFSMLGKAFITVSEVSAYALAVVAMSSQTLFRPDFVVVCLFAVAITMSFCNHSYLGRILSYKTNFVGEYAMCFYLADRIGRHITDIAFPTELLKNKIFPCLLITVMISFEILILGKALKFFGKLIKNKMRALVIVE